MTEREQLISTEQNWIQRYVIQRCSLGENSTITPQLDQETIDPLTSVKQHYFEVFTGEYKHKDMPPEIESAVHNKISQLVDASAQEAYLRYSECSQIISQLPHHLQSDKKQFLNKTAAEIYQYYEKYIDASVRYMADNDPLSNSKLGELIRHFIPSKKMRIMNQTISEANRNTRDLTEEFYKQLKNN
jgi:hypothetical protein